MYFSTRALIGLLTETVTLFGSDAPSTDVTVTIGAAHTHIK